MERGLLLRGSRDNRILPCAADVLCRVDSVEDLEIRNCPEFSGQPSVTSVLRGLGGCGPEERQCCTVSMDPMGRF